jgi:hypothetical protein
MSDIARARAILEELKEDVATSTVYEIRSRIDYALVLMRRTITKKRAISRRKPLTEEQKIAIRKYFESYPRTPLDAVAQRYGVANGRISEALRGI